MNSLKPGAGLPALLYGPPVIWLIGIRVLAPIRSNCATSPTGCRCVMSADHRTERPASGLGQPDAGVLHLAMDGEVYGCWG